MLDFKKIDAEFAKYNFTKEFSKELMIRFVPVLLRPDSKHSLPYQQTRMMFMALKGDYCKQYIYNLFAVCKKFSLTFKEALSLSLFEIEDESVINIPSTLNDIEIAFYFGFGIEPLEYHKK